MGSPAQEAADLYRGLARARPEAFTPDLAMSLNNLANALSELGRRDEALTAAQEAADLYRGLARARPEAFTPDLATSLNNLAIRLSELGRREEAVAISDESKLVLEKQFAPDDRAKRALNRTPPRVLFSPQKLSPRLSSPLFVLANRSNQRVPDPLGVKGLVAISNG